MMLSIRRIPHLVLFVAVASTGLAASPRRMNNAGVAAYEQGEYESAARHFEQAGEKDPENLRLFYNLGAAQAAADHEESALRNFDKAAQARDTELADRARFAKGVLLYRSAWGHLERQELEQALKSAREAAEANAEVLLNNPNAHDAQINYELAENLRREIEQLLQQMDQEQRQEQQGEDSPEDQESGETEERAGEDEQEAPQQSGEEEQESESEQPDPGEEGEGEDSDDGNDFDSSESEGAEEDPEDVSLSVLNLLDDEDGEIMKRMLQRQYRGVAHPERDW